ncbi:MAG: aldehyde dehydrogenase family protein, partial [Henriciella sp.]|nr:aldehyde dehydrogenase family protein [Henriciella sp.]
MAFHTSLLEPHLVSKSGMNVFDPATGESITQVRVYSAAEVEEIISAADSAKSEWADLTAKARAAILKKWNDLILENRNLLAELITLESGKPLAEAQSEVAYGASFVEWFAEEGKRTYGDVIPRHASGKQPIVIKQPVGVTAAITPWNFPLAMITRKAGPALAAGCPMIVKPAESTPLTALALETLAHLAGIPKAIFRTLPTNDPATIGKVFCSSSKVRKLSFTGSTAVGKTLLSQCAGTVKRVSMELGGNAPFIVFDDADIDAAVEGAMASKYRNAGQTCVCANRFLIHDSIHDEFVEKLVKKVTELNVGNGR